MESPKATDAIPEASDLTLPAADAEGELNPGGNRNVEVDPISSQMTTSLQIKEQAEAEAAAQEEKEKETGEKDAMQTLKRGIIVSGAIVAVAGAVFAIAKKLKEK